jgi:hypothetical protein
MSHRTETLRDYTKALLALCTLLGISTKTLQGATSTTRGQVSNWRNGRRTLQPKDEHAVFDLLTQAATRLPITSVPDEPTALTYLEAIFTALLTLDQAWLDSEKAYAQWLRGRAAPVFHALNTKLDRHMSTPRTRQHLTQTRDDVRALLEDLPYMWEEAKTRNRLLKALGEDLTSATIPPTRKLHLVSEVLVRMFGERVWPADNTDKEGGAVTEMVTGRPTR